jgi:hypothetical protein
MTKLSIPPRWSHLHFSAGFPAALIRETENQRDSQELVIYRVDFGGQGRNRTTDTRIFSPSDRNPFPQNPAGDHSVLVVEAEIE